VTATPRPGQSPAPPRPPPTADDGRLQRELDAFLKEQRGNFGVAIRDLGGPVAASFEADDRFPLGSLFKLPLMAEVMRQVRGGKIALGQSVQTLTDYDFGEPQGGIPPATRVSVEEALTAMISVSSNAAALALIDLVGPDELIAAPKRLGLTNTAIDVATYSKGRYEIDARSSARDILQMLVKLDREQLVGPQQDRKMIDLLLGQKIDDRIPVLLPSDVPIAHKTADLDGFTHDAGIVYLPGRPFAIAILAQGLNPTDGKAQVSEIARIAYAYFSS
jgi:beta-lactamase class A